MRAQDEPAVPLVGRMGLLPGLSDLPDLGAGLRQRHLRAQTRPEVQHAGHSQVEQVGLRSRHQPRQNVQRDVERARQHELEAGERGRRHADHRERHAVQPQFPADDRGIPVERLHPGVVRDHRHGVAAGHLILVGAEEAAQLRPYLQDVEQVAADGEAETAFGLVFATERKARDQDPVRGHAGEAPRRVTKLAIGEIRETRPAPAVVRSGAVDGDDIATPGYRQRPQHQAVGDAEHRRAHGDANGDRRDGDQREARVLDEHSQSMAHILNQCVKHQRVLRLSIIPRAALRRD